LNQIAHVGVNPNRGLKLFGHEFIFYVFQPVSKSYFNVTDRQTDRQTDKTDDLLWHNRAQHRAVKT